MKNKGFTLIELLAVIVILAIIALIATPIILGIINDSRNESNERSAELYLSAVKLAIAQKNLNEEYTPTECNINNGVVTCVGYDEPLEVEVSGKAPESGVIKFENNTITVGTKLNFSGFSAELSETGRITLGSNVVVEESKICTFANSGEEKKVGAKYTCDFGEDESTKNLVFYVLEEADSNGIITLIYEKNYDDTTQTWCQSGTSTTCNANGLDAKLNEIRTAYSKLDSNQIGIPSYEQIYSAAGNKTTGLPLWLYDNLNDPNEGWVYPFGYWTSTSDPDYVDVIYHVRFDGKLSANVYDLGSNSFGVRPIVKINASEI